MEYPQELDPVNEVDRESECDDGHTETTRDVGGTWNGPPFTVSFDLMSCVDGASSYTGPRDIPFSQRVPFHPSPKPHLRPQQRSTSLDLGECPTNPDAKTEQYKN